MTQIAANIILLDRVMAHYGPETKEARELLRRSVARAADQIWPEGNPPLTELGLSAESEDLYDKIQKLSPQNDAQRSLQAQALGITADLGHMRWLIFEHQEHYRNHQKTSIREAVRGHHLHQLRHLCTPECDRRRYAARLRVIGFRRDLPDP